eukprot:TRINITY_DN9227_c0_g2_i1.p1 TRINITY_DN9227_c0_g2~~TRINITY_DN9227_c0_g2_i1.p1  ORF type:complete len:615 (+),score=104.85 TRINITY_DN9227_c0_g2_i1:134-1846(+)
MAASSDDYIAEAECIIHALSACSRRLFPAIHTSDGPSMEVEAAVLRCCKCFPSLSAHPALQRTLVLLLGVIWPWLSSHREQLQDGFTIVLNSLLIPEEAALYPMRLMEDHVGCVALLKLSRAPDSGAVFDSVFDAWQQQEKHMTMTHASRQLLLESTASCALHAGEDAINQVLTATCERAAAFVNICYGHGPRAWQQPELVEGLILVLQEVTIVAKRTHGSVLTNTFGRLFTVNRTAPSFVQLLLLGAKDQPICLIKEVSDALRDLALAPLSDDDAGTEALTLSVATLFWEHFRRRDTSAASLNVFQGCLEAGAQRYSSVFDQLSDIIPAVLTGIDLSAMLAGTEPNPGLAEAFFNLLSACCEHAGSILTPYAQHLAETVLCETLTFSCVDLLASASVCRAIFGLITTAVVRREDGSNFLDIALQHNASIGPSLLCGLLTGVCELFPSFLLEETVACIRKIILSYDINTVCLWLTEAVERPDFPRVSVSAAAKQQFLDDVRNSATKGMSRLKNTIKKFCGGKKKGQSGTPANGDVSPAMLRKQFSQPQPVRFTPQDGYDLPGQILRSHSV